MSDDPRTIISGLLVAISSIHTSYQFTHRLKSRVSNDDGNMAAELDCQAGASIQRAEDWLESTEAAQHGDIKGDRE